MTEAPPDRATLLLNRLNEGDESVSDELLELIYAELRLLAESHMSRESEHHTLQPTALVHEAWMRLVGDDGTSYESRGHFYSLASRVMRSCLVDHARRKKSKKRGGNLVRVALEGRPDGEDGGRELDVLDVHEALDALAGVDAELASVVEMRFFGGLTVPETATALDLPQRTVERRWRVASAWLQERLHGQETD